LVVRGQTIGRLEITGRRDQESAVRKMFRMGKLVEDVERAVTRLTARRPALAARAEEALAASFAEE
jgi:hypothetical protein